MIIIKPPSLRIKSRQQINPSTSTQPQTPPHPLASEHTKASRLLGSLLAKSKKKVASSGSVSGSGSGSGAITITLEEQLTAAMELAGLPGGSEGLAAYLITPIQRIPRYKLLLTRIMDSSTDGGGGAAGGDGAAGDSGGGGGGGGTRESVAGRDAHQLVAALGEVSRVAGVIDGAIYGKGDARALAKISASFIPYTSVAAEGRRLIKKEPALWRVADKVQVVISMCVCVCNGPGCS